jgi:hypothetical protein
LQVHVSLSGQILEDGVAVRSVTPEQLDEFADQLKLVARAGLTPLQAHLASKHSLANASAHPDHVLYDIHAHEHAGPCTIRDHDPASLHADITKAVSVIREGQDQQ